ncbi:MAG: branched-chain amino acid ABC transporter permease [Microbacterium hominis]|uniref:ABC transporter permease subunit n=1 Tax=Microbacterium aurum TaxID=36805 RepID=UPI00248E8893|nr:branched-chain amino acid ABC transporter permease [Microbacterium aurum]MBZ6371156.1 branched-chain amino acid ABC transporter permease [Microbacterium hominis]
MRPTSVTARNPLRWFVLFLGALLAAGALLLSSPGTAVAAGSDDTGDGEDLPYNIVVNVRSGGEPVAGATVTATDGTFEGEGTTNEQGRALIGVPEKESAWTIELVESSLPSGVSAPDGFEFTQEATFGAGSSVTKNFTLVAAERQTTSFWDQFASRAVNGLNFGLMLALAAIGLSLVFGTTGLSNFAHGEMVTFGALMALLFSAGVGWSIWIAIPLAVILSAAFGYTMDAGLWRPLRRKGLGTVQLMIVSIGLSLALRYLYQMFVGGGTEQLPGAITQTIPGLGPIRLSVTDVISMAISIVVIGAFAWWLMRTRIGRATRAVSDNPSLAAASGIDVDGVVRIVWVVAAALAGLSGVLWAYFRPGIKWDMGTSILLLVFAAVTLGGLGTAFGALIGSIIVGLLVEVSTLWIPSDLKYVGALVVLIVILLFRPQGILGRRERIG